MFAKTKLIEIEYNILYYYNAMYEDEDEQRRITVPSCTISFCRVTSDMGIGRAEQVRQQTMFVHSVDCKG